jgi:hypothetical protein
LQELLDTAETQEFFYASNRVFRPRLFLEFVEVI